MQPWSKTMAPVDLDKIRAHMAFIRGRVKALEGIAAGGRERFAEDEILQAAAVRYLHTAIEAMIDIANHIVARQGIGLPTSYREAIDLLVNEGVLPEGKREAFGRMVSFRNRAVHLYDSIEEEEVFKILSGHLEDFGIFVSAVAARFFEE